MDNKVEALLAISDKANEHFKYLLFYTPQEEKLMFQRLRDVLEMTSELTERIERISDDFINKKHCLRVYRTNYNHLFMTWTQTI